MIARYWFQQGYDVLNPIGWDSFGLPAENAAIKRNDTRRRTRTPTSRPRPSRSGSTRMCFDWSRRLHTSDPEYYRWTQWLFLRFYERGLAYRKRRPSTGARTTRPCWPTSRSSHGRCERCGAEVTKRELTQWYFKITDYAQRLLDDMDALEGSGPTGS